ncbi:MAG: MBL fold metallo-hydrolase [Paracoccaceae bacterium]|nr:MAG: MBL fold metallo-hydrolase [Paracoccaceae bacterium]
MAGGKLRRVVAPNPSALTGQGTNTWLVGHGEVIVIDPGPQIPAHLDAILSALSPGETVARILVTHAHSDHSPLARDLSRITGAPVCGFGPPDAGRSAIMRDLAAAGFSGGGEGVDPAFAPDILLAEGDTVTAGAVTLRTLHIPGHFAGHLAFAWDDRLFSGDHVMGWATTLVSPPDGDMGAYMASLERLAAGSWARFHTGHGDDVTSPLARLAELAAHRRGREAAILMALRDGPADLAALTTRVYADTAPALHRAAARNAFAHLIDLWSRDRITARPQLATDAVFALR